MNTIRRNGQVFWDVVDGVMVLCDTDSTEFFHLNPTGALVWEACNGLSLDDVVGRLQAAYPNEDRERLTKDVAEMIRSLEKAGLVAIRDD